MSLHVVYFSDNNPDRYGSLDRSRQLAIICFVVNRKACQAFVTVEINVTVLKNA